MAFSTAFQRNAFQNNAFQIAATTEVGGDGRRRYRRLTQEQLEDLRKVIEELRKKKEAKEKSVRQRILEAQRAELEAQIFAMLMARPEEQWPAQPAPYRPPLPLIHAFNFGQYLTDREKLAELQQELELLVQELAELDNRRRMQ